jgi:hypothetical protein
LQELLHEESYSSDARNLVINLEDARNLVINLEDLCQKIRKAVCDHLRPFLEPLIQMPPPKKYHMIFSLFLDPRFVSLKDLLDLHSREHRCNLDKISYSKPYYIQQMKDKLLDYIAAAEKATNPIPASSRVVDGNKKRN